MDRTMIATAKSTRKAVFISPFRTKSLTEPLTGSRSRRQPRLDRRRCGNGNPCMVMLRTFALAACAFLPVLSCSASGGDAALGAAGGGDAGVDVIQTGTGGSTVDAQVGDGTTPPLVGEVFAHSDDTLYKLEPISKTVTVVGTFDCVGTSGGGAGMWDIAVDKDGEMYGSANGLAGGSLVRIQRNTAHCDTIVTGSSFPNSMTFVPAGTLDPNEEVLVGYDRADYLRIDKVSGQVTKIGSLNPNSTGEMWESSGDIVSIIDGGTYLTVKVFLGPVDGQDAIVEVDPKTGQATKLIGNTSFQKLWGLGYWGGIAYGFSETGQLCSIDLGTGKGTLIPIPNLPAGLSFWGAGVTTAAPIEMPK